ncbi:MAG: glycosyltransferase, partial [Alphaproteobacteria bacterium]|nr:glycosyltransferase [Alphaproteobacteria bacterium]
MPLPRLVFFALFAAATTGLIALFAAALAPGGWTAVKLALLVCFLPAAPWLGICIGNALPGFLILMFARNPARFVLLVDGDIETGAITLRTAIAVTIRNEDMGAVLPPLARLFEDLADPAHFTLFLLSDTQDQAIAAAEAAAIAGFPHPLRYRRRAENSGFKAGNVMEFLDHHVDGHDLVLMLDADSTMSADAVRR